MHCCEAHEVTLQIIMLMRAKYKSNTNTKYKIQIQNTKYLNCTLVRGSRGDTADHYVDECKIQIKYKYKIQNSNTKYKKYTKYRGI